MWTLNNEHNEMTSIIVKLKLDNQVINEELGYGSPAEVLLNVSSQNSDKLNVELVWQGKYRLDYLKLFGWRVRPALRTLFDGDWSLSVDKIGNLVNVSDVVDKGGATVHGFDPDGGIIFSNANAQLEIKSSDCGVVAPGYNMNPWNYNAYDDGNVVDPLDGAAFFYMGIYTIQTTYYGIRLKIKTI